MTSSWRRFSRQPAGVVGLFSLIVIIGAAILASVVAPFSPNAIGVGSALSPPSRKHLMGTDDLGRDMYSRVVWGSRASLTVGLVSTGIATLLGVPVGAVAGYFGGHQDNALMRLTDLFLVVPPFFLALTTVALLGNSFWLVILVIAVLSWPSTARLVRGAVLSQKQEAYVEAARAVGAGHKSILWRHILPNALPPIIVNTSVLIARAILLEAGLSFLGAGDPNITSWGWMLNSGFRFIVLAWWMITFPGLALFATAMGFNIVGDALNDVLNPRLRMEVTSKGGGCPRAS